MPPWTPAREAQNFQFLSCPRDLIEYKSDWVKFCLIVANHPLVMADGVAELYKALERRETNKESYGAGRGRVIRTLFILPALLLALLDGFDQHNQASVHFPVTSTLNKSQQHEKLQFWYQ